MSNAVRCWPIPTKRWASMPSNHWVWRLCVARVETRIPYVYINDLGQCPHTAQAKHHHHLPLESIAYAIIRTAPQIMVANLQTANCRHPLQQIVATSASTALLMAPSTLSTNQVIERKPSPLSQCPHSHLSILALPYRTRLFPNAMFVGRHST